MLLEPYNKANCLAMLNTLFPPVQSANVQPKSKLTPKILQTQREGFWRYINTIESAGKQILTPVMQQGARDGDGTAWPLIAEALDKYLTAAVDVIDECMGISGPEGNHFAPEPSHKRHPGSGTSFGSSEGSFASSNATDKTDGLVNKPLPPSPDDKPRKTSGSTLERIAQELRKMRIRPDSPTKGFDKKKSSANLADSRQQSFTSLSGSDISNFQIDNFKRNRLIWEASKKQVGGAADAKPRFMTD
jgi:hypothetical protein